MNTRTYFLALLLLGCIFTVSCPKEAAAGPRIRVNPEVFDFGYIPEGQSVSHRYWLGNYGNDTLVIQEVKPQCGCTTVPLTRDRLAPSDSLPLDLSFDSKNMRGRVNKAVRIWSNDSAHYPEVIYFTADVADSTQSVLANPPVASLTSIDNPHQIIELHNLAAHSYKLRLATPAPPFLNCNFSSDSVAAGGTVTLDLTSNALVPLGTYTTSISLQCEGEVSFTLTIPVKGVGYMQ